MQCSTLLIMLLLDLWRTSLAGHSLCTCGTVSDAVVSNTGAPQGTVLSPFLFTLYTTDFSYQTESCHLQKFSDDSAVVGCISKEKAEYRAVVDNFVSWCELNHLQLNTTKTKELVVDLRRTRTPVTSVSILGHNVDIVEHYKYLGVFTDNKLDRTKNTEVLYKKGQSRLYFLRRLRSFNICQTMLRMFFEPVVASAVLFAVVCRGSSRMHHWAPQEDIPACGHQTVQLLPLMIRLKRLFKNKTKLILISFRMLQPFHCILHISQIVYFIIYLIVYLVFYLYLDFHLLFPFMLYFCVYFARSTGTKTISPPALIKYSDSLYIQSAESVVSSVCVCVYVCVCVPAGSRWVTGWPLTRVMSEAAGVTGARPVTVLRAESSSWLWLEERRASEQSERQTGESSRWTGDSLPAAAAADSAGSPGDAGSAGSDSTSCSCPQWCHSEVIVRSQWWHYQTNWWSCFVSFHIENTYRSIRVSWHHAVLWLVLGNESICYWVGYWADHWWILNPCSHFGFINKVLFTFIE